MKSLSLLRLLLFFVLLVMLPFVFGQVFASALVKLKLDPTMALLVVIGIFLGSPINIPVKRISRTESVPADPSAVFGLSRWWPAFRQMRRETFIAVNVGGCLIPVALAIYETAHVILAGRQPLSGLLLAIFINTVACYWLANPIEGIGIAMPGLFPPPCLQLYALSPSFRTTPLRWPLPPAYSALLLGPICSIFAISKRSPPASPVSEEPALLMESCSPELLRHTWRERETVLYVTLMFHYATEPGFRGLLGSWIEPLSRLMPRPY